MGIRLRLLGVLATTALLGCEAPDLTVPSAAEVESRYVSEHPLTVEMSGNVAEVTVVQPTAQLRRGGALWAKLGPYVYLFTESTRELFESYGGLAGVRVVTRTPDGTEVARALLERDELNDVTWRRALNIAGRARRDGTGRIRLMEELISWGEDHTTHHYGAAYTGNR